MVQPTGQARDGARREMQTHVTTDDCESSLMRSPKLRQALRSRCLSIRQSLNSRPWLRVLGTIMVDREPNGPLGEVTQPTRLEPGLPSDDQSHAIERPAMVLVDWQ